MGGVRGEESSCMLVEAIQAASLHTSGAHLVLVANGFKLHGGTKKAIVSGFLD